jgi:RHS repeat-associated protein
MLVAAKFGDPVLGVDIHMVLVPAPPAPPIPTPLPHPFIGVVFDPIGLAMGCLMSAVFGGGGPVLINSMPCGNTGTEVKGVPHFPTPPGVSFAPNDIPGNEGVLFMGSLTVNMGGDSIARLTDMVISCNFPINLPTSVCLAVPMGPPVLVGGPPAINFLAAATQMIRTKWVSDKLHALLKAKPGSRLSKVICFLTGHPVDVVSGEVLTDAVDLELGGYLPLRFERAYASRDVSPGALGAAGWRHNFEASVSDEGWRVCVQLPDGRERWHPALREGESLFDPWNRYTLLRGNGTFELVTEEGQTLRFARVDDDPRHRLVRVTDRLGHALTPQWRGGRMEAITDSVGRVVRLVHDSRGRLAQLRVVGRDGAESTRARYEYDATGMLSAVTDPLGHTQRYAYRGGVLVEECDRAGMRFYFEYDWEHPRGSCVRTWGDGGVFDRRITYQRAARITVVDDSVGGRTLYFTNDLGLVDKKVDAEGGEWRWEWTEHAQPRAVVDPEGGRVEYEYDERGRCVAVRNAEGATTRFAWDASNLCVAQTDPAGGVWRHERDPRGSCVRSTDPLGGCTEREFDAHGMPVLIRHPDGSTQRFAYDDAGNMVALANGAHPPSRLEFDGDGRWVRQIDELGRVTSAARDACGRLTEVNTPDEGTWRAWRDPEGRLLRTVDGRGASREYARTRNGWLAARTDACGETVRFEQDTEGNLVSIRDASGTRCERRYDRLGRMVHERRADGVTMECRWDRAGRLSATVDARGAITRYRRSPGGAVTEILRPDKRRTRYTWDALGRAVEGEVDGHAVRFERDAIGRVLRETQGDAWVESRYDAGGNKVERRSSLGDASRFAYDDRGLLQSADLRADPEWFRWSPDALSAGRVVEAPRGVVIDRDPLGRVGALRWWNGARTAWSADAEGRLAELTVSHHDQPLLACAWQWNGGGSPSLRVDAARGATRNVFAADGRWLRAEGVDESARFAADFSATPDGFVQTQHGLEHRADALGRRQTTWRDGARVVRYEWNAAHQLVEVERLGRPAVNLRYDAFGRRIEKRVGDQVTRYLWDGNELLRESGERSRAWVFEPLTFQLLAQIEGERVRPVVLDAAGTPLAILSDDGREAAPLPLGVRGEWLGGDDADVCPWRWQGQFWDADLALHDNRFRVYDPVAGAYLSPDPIGLRGGLWPYAGVPDPYLWIDPLGLILVFRNLRPDESSAAGLSARNPSRGMSAAGHVRNGSSPNFKGSQWISTTTDPEVALSWRKAGQTTVAIETDLVTPSAVGNRQVLDISTPDLAANANLRGPAAHYAAASREVLIDGRVPPSAMIEVSEDELKAYKCT